MRLDNKYNGLLWGILGFLRMAYGAVKSYWSWSSGFQLRLRKLRGRKGLPSEHGRSGEKINHMNNNITNNESTLAVVAAMSSP